MALAQRNRFWLPGRIAWEEQANMELALTPNGRLILSDGAGGGEAALSAADGKRLAKAFAGSAGEGLFVLAASRFDGPLPPSFGYWRDFAGRYLTELCHTPALATAEIDPIAPPGSGELASLILCAPPMVGAEYLSQEVLESLWLELDQWVRAQVASFEGALTAFLRKRAPLWHQVGRVCFHLAENRRDPDYPFALLATYAPALSGSGRVRYQPLRMALREYAGQKDSKGLVKLLLPVHRASEQSALVKELVDSGDLFEPLAWTPQQAYRFLKDVPLIEAAGVLVRLPDWWKKRPRAKVKVTIGQKRRNRFDAHTLLDFKVEVALGDEPLSKEEWRALQAADSGLVLLRGQWVEVDREKLSQVLDHWKQVEEVAGDGLSFIEAMRLLAGAPRDLKEEDGEEQRQWAFVTAGRWLRSLLERLRDPSQADAARPSSQFKAQLRPYQQVGVQWLWFVSELGLGACLADDMGLGKTIQVLGLLDILKRRAGRKPSLLVLPASLVANWKAEMARFAPRLRVRFAHPSETPRDELTQWGQRPSDLLEGIDVVVTTYGMLLRQPWMADVAWRLVVLDEAQAIKNPGAKQTKAVKRLKADARIALTGTPVENRLSDLWSLFDFLCPGLLGSQQTFKGFVKSLEDRRQDRYAPLRQLVRPYILRRLKTDKRIIADLPEKTEMRAFCGLTKRQASLYQKLVDDLEKALDGPAEGIQRRGIVLSYLMRFKQVCNHPSQLLGDGHYDPKRSGKFQRLAELCEEIASRQEKALIFTQFREMTEPIAAFLETVFGRPGLVLHGGTPVKRRKQIVDQFQREDGPPVLILSLKAGGTGLNLTAASHVIHFDRWWNPAVENQATDRAFRIGQRRNVLVHKFVCRGTIEERIDAMIEEKKQLSSELLEGGAEKLLTELSDEELLDLVSLDVNKAAV